MTFLLLKTHNLFHIKLFNRPTIYPNKLLNSVEIEKYRNTTYTKNVNNVFIQPTQINFMNCLEIILFIIVNF